MSEAILFQLNGLVFELFSQYELFRHKLTCFFTVLLHRMCGQILQQANRIQIIVLLFVKENYKNTLY